MPTRALTINPALRTMKTHLPLLLILLLGASAMAQTNFTLQTSQSYPSGTTTSPTLTVPPGTVSADVTVTAGPMPNANQSIDEKLQHFNGAAWDTVDELLGTGGMTASVKNGPADTPVSLTARFHLAVAPGQQYRTVTVVANGPITLGIAAVVQ